MCVVIVLVAPLQGLEDCQQTRKLIAGAVTGTVPSLPAQVAKIIASYLP